MLISICIPCYKSAKTLPVVVSSVKEEFEKHPEYDYQFVLVNDGSPDNTFEVIRELCEEDPKITGVDLSRNYGQASAKLCSLQYAKGDAVVFMDDDGQHPASGVFQLVEKLNEGYDAVYAHFKNKKHNAFKKITSGMHNWLSEKMGTKPKGIHRSSFMAWSRTAVDAVKKYRSPFPSIGGYMMHVTTKYANVDVEHKERISGHSGYTLKKMFGLWLNIFVSFSMVPLRVATFLGFFLSVFGFIWGLVLVIRKLFNPGIMAGYTSIIVWIILIGGIVMIMLGIIGEYLGRIYMTISDMPQYNIRTILNTEEENA